MTRYVGPKTDGTNVATQSDVDEAWSTPQSIEAKTGSYGFVTADAGKLITFNSASGINGTVDGSLNLAIGQRIDLLQLGDGQVTVVASSTTVNATPTLKLRAKYSAATLLCTGTDTYVLVGDLATA